MIPIDGCARSSAAWRRASGKVLQENSFQPFWPANCSQRGIDYFLDTVFNYPTLAECYKVAAYNASNKINYVKRIKARRAAAV